MWKLKFQSIPILPLNSWMESPFSTNKFLSLNSWMESSEWKTQIGEVYMAMKSCTFMYTSWSMLKLITSMAVHANEQMETWKLKHNITPNTRFGGLFMRSQTPFKTHIQNIDLVSFHSQNFCNTHLIQKRWKLCDNHPLLTKP